MCLVCLLSSLSSRAVVSEVCAGRTCAEHWGRGVGAWWAQGLAVPLPATAHPHSGETHELEGMRRVMGLARGGYDVRAPV